MGKVCKPTWMHTFLELCGLRVPVTASPWPVAGPWPVGWVHKHLDGFASKLGADLGDATILPANSGPLVTKLYSICICTSMYDFIAL